MLLIFSLKEEHSHFSFLGESGHSFLLIGIFHDDVNKWKYFPRYWFLCEGNPPVTGGYPSQKPVTRSFDVFFEYGVKSLGCPLPNVWMSGWVYKEIGFIHGSEETLCNHVQHRAQYYVLSDWPWCRWVDNFFFKLVPRGLMNSARDVYINITTNIIPIRVVGSS